MKNFPVNLLLDNFPYLVEEIADKFDANPKTILRWIKDGLPVLEPGTRPHLIMGLDVKAYYRGKKKNSSKRKKAGPGDFKCPSCGMLAPVNVETIRRIAAADHPNPNFPKHSVSFSAVCLACGKSAYRMESLRTETRLLEYYGISLADVSRGNKRLMPLQRRIWWKTPRVRNAMPNKDTQPTYLMTEKQAAAYLNFTPRFLQMRRLRGGGPVYVSVSPRAVRYRMEDLESWVQDRLRKSTSDTGKNGG